MNDDLRDLLEDADDEPQPRKRGPGRPPGSRNKPKETLLTEDRLQKMAARMRPYLSKEQLRYLDAVLKGDINVDPIREAELLTVQMRLMQSEAMAYMLDEGQGRVSRDYASFLSEYRQSIKDLFEMKRRAAADAKSDQDDDAVDLTSRDPLKRLGLD